MGSKRAVRWAGVTLGLATAAVLVAGWRLPPGVGAPGADLAIAAPSTGELGVTPPRDLLRGADITSGPRSHARRGAATVRNQTGRTLDIAVRARPSTGALDDVLNVTITAGGRRLYTGALDGLRTWSSGSFSLRRGEQARLIADAWIPEGTPRAAYVACAERVTLELRSTARRGP